jgi:hypothetical protein
MIFVLDTAVGLGIWLPFTFGKSTALLSVSVLDVSHSLSLSFDSSTQDAPYRCFIGLYASYAL